MGGTDCAHDVDLVEEGEAMGGVIGQEGVLFGKSLHCEVSTVSESLHLVDSRESPFAQLLDRLEETMEAELIDQTAHFLQPELGPFLANKHQLHWDSPLLLQSKPNGPS